LAFSAWAFFAWAWASMLNESNVREDDLRGRLGLKVMTSILRIYIKEQK
jgi:hypothetical protein